MIASEKERRAREIEEFNSRNSAKKRGLAVIPTKFGVCYEPTFLNQVCVTRKALVQ